MNSRESRNGSMSDDELAEAFRMSGNSEAFEELWFRHKRVVYLHCFSFFRRQPSLAEDATQKTFMNAFEKKEQFHGGSYLGWLKRIARNVCLDMVVAQKLLVSMERPDGRPATDEPFRIKPDFDREIELERLYKEMAKLPKDQSKCLDLQMQGYSYEEIAVELRMTIDATRSHIQNGKRTLKIRLQGARTV